jgi:hypothetical protein
MQAISHIVCPWVILVVTCCAHYLLAISSEHVADQSDADIFGFESGSGKFCSLKHLPYFVTIQMPGHRDEVAILKVMKSCFEGLL